MFVCVLTMMMHGVANECWCVTRGAQAGGRFASLSTPALARRFYRCPAVAVLDEPTSAVSEDAAAQLYAQLHSAGVTCISIGQDSLHLRRLHTHLLLLGCSPEAGTWQLQQLGCS